MSTERLERYIKDWIDWAYNIQKEISRINRLYNKGAITNEQRDFELKHAQVVKLLLEMRKCGLNEEEKDTVFSWLKMDATGWPDELIRIAKEYYPEHPLLKLQSINQR